MGPDPSELLNVHCGDCYWSCRARHYISLVELQGIVKFNNASNRKQKVLLQGKNHWRVHVYT